MSKTFHTVVADPPWPYRTGKALVGTGGRGASGVRDLPHGGSEARYGAMTMDDLKALEVPAADDAHLYLWTTNSFMVEAHDLARAWGFEPKTILTWVKMKSDGTPSAKMGYYFRGATEHVVFAVRGRQRLLTSDVVPTAFLAPRIMKHSAKPPAFYDLVERCSPGPHLEMFAREARPGWSAWGNELDNDVEIGVRG